MTSGQRIDLNSDLGESLDIVTSANVACGFHAGDSLTVQRTGSAKRTARALPQRPPGGRRLPRLGVVRTDDVDRAAGQVQPGQKLTFRRERR